MEEKKTYPETKVTITAGEYRDLITEAAENRKDAEFEKQNRWKLESEIKALNEEIGRLSNENTMFSNENRRLINEMAKLEVEIANYKEVCNNVCS